MSYNPEPAARSGRSRGPPWPCRRPPAPQPGPVGQADGLSETSVAFAHLCLCGVETAVAFAGEKWAFLVRFLVALVMVVSMVAVQGVRSGAGGFMLACISGCRGVIGCNVATGGVLCTKKFSLLGLMVGASATKFALRTKNGPKSVFCGVLGELFAEMPVEGRCWAKFFAPTGAVPRTCRRCGALQAGCGGGLQH